MATSVVCRPPVRAQRVTDHSLVETDYRPPPRHANCAEARRFPDLAASVHRMGRERGTEAAAQLLGELPESDQLPAFAADRRAATARHFIDLVLQPMLKRALFGEHLTALCAEIGPHVTRTVAFFLAACRQGGIG
jgi:hypothetical protein